MMVPRARSTSSPSSFIISNLGSRCNINDNSNNTDSANKVNDTNRTDGQDNGQDNDNDSSSSASRIGPIRNGGKKRDMANRRERERTKSLNEALEILRDRLPVPEAEKRSKIQTLRMAKKYIEFLAKFKRLSQQQQQQQQHQQPQQPQQQNNSPLNIVDEEQDHQIVGEIIDNKPSSKDSSSSSEEVGDDDEDQPLTGTQSHQVPDSPLTYKFYKFRLKSQNKHNDID